MIRELFRSLARSMKPTPRSIPKVLPAKRVYEVATKLEPRITRDPLLGRRGRSGARAEHRKRRRQMAHESRRVNFQHGA